MTGRSYINQATDRILLYRKLGYTIEISGDGGDQQW
jgi:hypothetical protein